MPADDNVDLGGSGGSSASGTSGSGTASAGHSGSIGSAGTTATGSGGSAGSIGAAGNGGTTGSAGASGGNVGTGGTASGGTASGGKGGTTGTGGTVASGGTGGSASGGTGGTVASGGSGGSVSGNGVSVQYKVVTADAMSPYMQCELYVVNAGPNTFAISELKARYYYTDDVKTTMQFTLNWKHIGTTGANIDDLTVTQTTMAMVPTKTNADTYLEFGFSSGTQSTISAGQSLAFSWRFNPQDQNLKFNQTNDYSFDASKTTQADWSHVVVLHNGTVVWGATP